MGKETATKLFYLSINFDPEREVNRKITTLLLALDSLFPKTEENARWFVWIDCYDRSRRFFFTSRVDLNSRKKLVNCYNWSIDWYCAETWTLRKADRENLGSFVM
jgi:chromosome condensin MukBEF complex kleisin-like MukF subunit